MQNHEKDLVGYVLRDPTVLIEAKRLGLTSRHFRNDRAQKLWMIFEKFIAENKPIDLGPVMDAYGPGDFYPVEAMTDTLVSMNVKYTVGKITEIYERKTSAMALSELAIQSDRCGPQDDWESIKTKIRILADDLLKTNKKSKPTSVHLL